ncbi:MAG: hypothetical protein GF398_03310 [Chitinivibrionales bacterium]|nr:hypothetical protein [Chitinivibrionales bacterium]
MLGIGVSFDKGDSWQTTFGLPSWEIGDFAFHPTNPNIVWAATMSGPCKSDDAPEFGAIWESTDGGETWSYVITLGGSRYNGKIS